MSNRNTRDIWNGEAGQDWAGNQADLDHFLRDSMQTLLGLLPLAAGARVLEIGSGSGTLSLAMARAVGPGGHVLGLDVSEQLLALARRRGAGLDTLDFRNLDIQTGDLDVTGFDFCASHVGMMFFSDPVLALSRLRQHLKPGATLAFNGWAGRANPWFSLPLQVAERHLGPLPSAALSAMPPPGPLAFADVTYVTGILARAGYSDPTGGQREIAIRHPDGLEALMRSIAYVGPISALYRLKQPEPALKMRIEAEIAEAFAPFVQGDGSVRLPAMMCYYTAAVR